MQTIETTDPIEARRARFAQYRGGKARFTLMGSTITGIVRSVMEVRSSTPKRWNITVIAKQSIVAYGPHTGHESRPTIKVGRVQP